MNELPLELTVPYLSEKYGYPIYLCPFLIPALLVRHNIETDDIEKYLLDKMVRKESGNTLRAFLDAGWTKAIDKNIHRPIKKKNNGKYKLPKLVDEAFDMNKNVKTEWIEQASVDMVNCINPLWLEQAVKRINAVVERHVFFIGTLRDNTTIHNYPNSHWAIHWLNPINNTRNTHPKSLSLYHYYEHWNGDSPAPPEMQLKQRVTGILAEAFYDCILGLIKARIPRKYWKYFGVEAGNEVPARTGWHHRMDGIVKKHKIPRKMKNGHTHYRRITSMYNANNKWFYYNSPVSDNFNYFVHGRSSVAKIVEADQAIKKAKFAPSCDGGHYPSPALAKKMTKKSLETKNYGLELLEGLWGGVELKDLNFKPARGMMRAFKAWNI